MSFSQLEAILAGYGTNPCREIETPPHLAWTAYKHVQYDVDGLVHRVVSLQTVGTELSYDMEPWTGCGILLKALAGEGPPIAVGFRSEACPLTCMQCMSDKASFVDRLRQLHKQALFGRMYGMPIDVMRHRVFPARTPRPFRKALAKKLLELALAP